MSLPRLKKQGIVTPIDLIPWNWGCVAAVPRVVLPFWGTGSWPLGSLCHLIPIAAPGNYPLPRQPPHFGILQPKTSRLFQGQGLPTAVFFLNSIFDTESKYVYYIGNNKYIIPKTKCWPVFKQDPGSEVVTRINLLMVILIEYTALFYLHFQLVYCKNIVFFLRCVNFSEVGMQLLIIRKK